MTTAAIKEKLHSYIDVADDKELKMIYTILEDSIENERYDWSQDKDFVAELDERVRRWEERIDPGYSIGEVKVYLDQQRKERQRSATK